MTCAILHAVLINQHTNPNAHFWITKSSIFQCGCPFFRLVSLGSLGSRSVFVKVQPFTRLTRFPRPTRPTGLTRPTRLTRITGLLQLLHLSLAKMAKTNLVKTSTHSRDPRTSSKVVKPGVRRLPHLLDKSPVGRDVKTFRLFQHGDSVISAGFLPTKHFPSLPSIFSEFPRGNFVPQVPIPLS